MNLRGGRKEEIRGYVCFLIKLIRDLLLLARVVATMMAAECTQACLSWCDKPFFCVAKAADVLLH